MAAKFRKKINRLIFAVGSFGPGTKVNIITKGDRPLFYNKDDNSLDIHGLLLLDKVSDSLLLFCGWHDARHKQITGLSALLEEVLNIYMDFEYLDKMGPQDAISLVNELESLDGSGYTQILQRRFSRKAVHIKEQDELLDLILRHIWFNCPWITRKLSIKSTSQEEVPLYELRRLVNNEIVDKSSPINALKNMSFVYEDFPGSISSFLAQSIHQIVSFLYIHIEFFKDLEDKLHIITGTCEIEHLSIKDIADRTNYDRKLLNVLMEVLESRGDVIRVYLGGKRFVFTNKGNKKGLVPGLDSDTGKIVYITEGQKKEPWAQGYILNKEIKGLWGELLEEVKDETTEVFLENIWRVIATNPNIEQNIKNIKVAILMAKAGANKYGIAASLVQGIELKNFEKQARGLDISKNEQDRITKLIYNYRRICSVFNYEQYPSRHMIQNIINLIIQLSEGDADILILTLMNEIVNLRFLADEPGGYGLLSDKDKFLLRLRAEWIYSGLAEFLGRNDWADEIRDLYLRAILGEEYILWEEEPCEILKLGNRKYSDLFGINNRIIEIARDALKDLPVIVSGRVKSVYSLYSKQRGIKDVLGLIIVITGGHSPEDLGRLRHQLNEHLEKLFIISESDKKRLIDKSYNEYDFIAKLNPEHPCFKKLLTDYNFGNPMLELQIYPTEGDFYRYQFGPTAHWLYRLEAIIRDYRKGYRDKYREECPIPDQVFDRDLLEGLYREKLESNKKFFKEGDFYHNFSLIYETLKKWKFIGVIRDGKLRIVRASTESIAPDIVSSPVVDMFNEYYIGLHELGAEKDISNIKPKELLPCIYEVTIKKAGKKGLGEDESKRIKDTTNKPRTYLIASKLLGEKISESDGKKILDSCLQELGVDFKRGYLEWNLFDLKEDGLKIGLVYKAFSLATLDEFYEILALSNQSGEEVMLRELVRRTYHYMTGLNFPGDINLKELRNRWNIKSKEPIAILVYLFTIAEKGKKYLGDECKINPDDTNNKKKLLALMDELGIDDLTQFYGRLITNELLAQLIKLRLRSISSPYILIRCREPSEIKASIEDVIDRSGVGMSFKGLKDGIQLDIKPSRYWLERMDMVLEELRALDKVDNAELIYEEPQVIPMVFRLNVKYIDIGKVEETIIDLFEIFGIRWNLAKKTVENVVRYMYTINVPTSIASNELEDIIARWLERGLGKACKITTLRVVTLSKPKTDPTILMVLLMFFTPYILGSAGSFVLGEYIILFLDLLLAIYLGNKLYRRFGKKRFRNKMGELSKIWQGYEKDIVRHTELLDPFYEEHVITTKPINYVSVLNGLELRWVARVVKKVSDTPIRELNYIDQGYVISARYEGKEYKFFILENWSDIAYETREGEYISLGKEIVDACKEGLKQKVDNFFGKWPKRTGALERLVIAPMKERDVLEAFCRNNFIAYSVINHFPRTDNPYPDFNHNKYILRPDERGIKAQYSPRRLDDRGLIGRALLHFTEGLDALHEICHGIFDYDQNIREKIIAHFERYPNGRLERMIAGEYGYDLNNPNYKERLIDGAFAYALSEFAGMSRPSIRLMDVKFFAEIGLIEPWMNPLELGYSRSQVDRLDFWVDNEYYLRIIEFLIERGNSQDKWYKMDYNGEWAESPFGEEALDYARRLAWGLIKTSYGIFSLEDLSSEYDLNNFWKSDEVVYLWGRIANAEIGASIKERFNLFLEGRKERKRRKDRMDVFIKCVKGKQEDVVRGIIFREPWIVQAFFGSLVLDKPRVLILDAQVFGELDKGNSKRLVDLINQINGKVVIVSNDEVVGEDVMEKIYSFYDENSLWLNERVMDSYSEVLDNIYIRDKNENSEIFAKRVGKAVKRRFKVESEDIMIFTTMNGFYNTWHKFLKESLFYIMYKGNIYITSEDLYTIQRLTGKTIISVKPGEKIELLTEELYKGAILEEESRTPVGKSV